MSTIKGGTTLYATVISVANGSAVLETNRGQVVATIADPEVEAEVRDGTGETRQLIGDADWDITTMEVVSFSVRKVGPYRPGADYVAVMARLRELSNGCWDDVDPDEYVREMRGDD